MHGRALGAVGVFWAVVLAFYFAVDRFGIAVLAVLGVLFVVMIISGMVYGLARGDRKDE